MATVYCLFSRDVATEVKNYLKRAKGKDFWDSEFKIFIFADKQYPLGQVRKQTVMEAQQRLKEKQRLNDESTDT